MSFFCKYYAVVRPYKLNFRNSVDIFILFMLGVFSGMLLVATFHPATKAPFVYFALGTGLVLYIPHMVNEDPRRLIPAYTYGSIS